MDDLTAVTNLLNTSVQLIRPVLQILNENLLKSDWTGPSFKLAESARVAETAKGEIVGYIEVWDTDPLPVSNWVWARVHPEFEGLGIGIVIDGLG